MFMPGSIKPVTYHEQICKDLDEQFLAEPNAPDERVRLVCLLFAKPEMPLAKQEIIPNLSYFHHRSGKHVDFYCGGYHEGPVHSDPERGVVRVENGWVYSDPAFVGFCSQIASMSTWQYSGGVDLVLTNAKFSRPRGFAKIAANLLNKTPVSYLDFSSAVVVNLEKMKEDGAITSLGTFFELIFQYAERQDGIDPAWGWSDAMGGRLAGSIFSSILFWLLPDYLKKQIKTAFHFVVKDISKQQHSDA